MDKERLKEQWLKEERAAHIQGWDFSHIQGRYEEENDLPWSYRAVIEQYLESRYRLLDLDTGGGEFYCPSATPIRIPAQRKHILPTCGYVKRRCVRLE